jgi:hypothetical protein
MLLQDRRKKLAIKSETKAWHYDEVPQMDQLIV